jgi:dynein heavy chain
MKHIKKDKLLKAINNKDGAIVIEEFLNGDLPCLLINGDSGAPTMELPERLPKNKWFYMLKRNSDELLPTENISKSVTCGDMAQDPLEHMERTMREVILPQLQNELNQGYGEVEYKEIMIRLNSFLASASITVGKINGETRLPLPPLHNQEADVMNKDLVHALEGAVVTWTAQIKAILERSHESSLKHGDNPTPDEELRFWESQSANLNAIFLQLKSKQMRNVMIFLDQCKSVYCAPFARLCREVFAARLESNNNVKFLRTLEKWFKTLNSADDLNDLKDLFRPMLHIILLIWKNSKYYNTPQRLSVLVRKVCNAIINRCCSFLSGKAILGKITDWEH